MKRVSLCLAVILLMAAFLTACSTPTPTEPAVTQIPSTAPIETTPATQVPTEETMEPTEALAETTGDTGSVSSEYVDEAYAEIIGRYYTALTAQWDADQYFDNGMSALASYYYDGNPLENVGFGYLDLNNDGQNELIIGAILNADRDPSVFEIWTITDGKPVMLAQGGSGNRYILQFVDEDNIWYVVNEASNNAASNATYYMMIIEDKLEITQGILFDAAADPENPWFMTYDLDWDASNDDPIDEDMANAILENNRNFYTALEYFPYSYLN